MSWKSFRSPAVAFIFASAFTTTSAHADAPLLSEVHTVALANAVVPAEHTFTVSSGGNGDTYTLTLTDFGATAATPVPLQAVKLAVTSGGTLVGTPMTAAGSTSFKVATGDYVIHVVGTLGDPGSGHIGIHITNSANDTVYDFADDLAPPPDAIPLGGSGIDDTFTVPASGNYQVTLSDLQLPQALSTLTLAMVQEGGSLITTLPAAGSVTVALQSGVNYRVFAVGSVNAPLINAGLFGANITPAGSTAPVYSKTVPVGAVTLLGAPMLTATNYTLTASDLQLPSGLQQFGAVVSLNSQAVATLNTTGTQTFAASAATYQVFGVGVVPAASLGSYTVNLKSAQDTVLNVARAVVDPATTDHAYSFDSTLQTGQTYAFDIGDFSYPAPFTTLTAAVVQNGALVTGSQLTIGTSVANAPATGTANVAVAAGPVSIIVFAQSATASAGLFGVDLTAGGTAAFATTQGVGQIFSVRKLTIVTAGRYAVTVGDVEFPAKFANLAAIVTHGTSRVGSIYGGGTFGFSAVAGEDYAVNFVAQPTGQDQAGTYSMVVATAPTPTLDFSATPTSVSSGGSATLKWTGTNVTSCTASNGWSGSKSAADSFPTGALTATTIYVLSCDGPGGPVSQTVTVTVNSASAPAKSGGGGAIRTDILLVLFGLLLFRRRIFPC